MSLRVLSRIFIAIACFCGLAACGPSDPPPVSLYWDVSPPSASTNAVLMDSAVYISELVAEVTQHLRCTGEPSEPTTSL
jgi:hypothetical protein